MARLFPSKQTVVDQPNSRQVIITTVTGLTTTSDHVELPNAVDAALLQSARTTADPTFYLATNGRSFAIDGATVGTEYVIVSRHEGSLNFGRGKNARGDNNPL
jgi:hypothetical protein